VRIFFSSLVLMVCSFFSLRGVVSPDLDQRLFLGKV
jgi:hypothetical protein